MGLEEDIKQKKAFSNEYEKLLVNIIYSNSFLTEQQNKIFKPFAITIPQYNVLRILRGAHPKPATINLIIDRMLDRMSNASRIVDRLESKQLVERKVCQYDKRAKDVVITELGLEVLSKVDDALALWYKNFKAISEEDAATANHVLDEVRAIFS